MLRKLQNRFGLTRNPFQKHVPFDQRQLLFPAATIRIPVAPPSRTSCDE